MGKGGVGTLGVMYRCRAPPGHVERIKATVGLASILSKADMDKVYVELLRLENNLRDSTPPPCAAGRTFPLDLPPRDTKPMPKSAAH